MICFQLRQKSLARSIGVTLATNSLSAPPSPSKESKSATLGPSSIRTASRPPLVHPSSSTHEFRGRVPLSLPRGASSAAVSLPVGSRHTIHRHTYHNGLKKVPPPPPHTHTHTLTLSLCQDDEDDSSEDGSEELSHMETDFCDSCCKYFANSLMKVCAWHFYQQC